MVSAPKNLHFRQILHPSLIAIPNSWRHDFGIDHAQSFSAGEHPHHDQFCARASGLEILDLLQDGIGQTIEAKALFLLLNGVRQRDD